MSQFIETIRLLDGRPGNLAFHQARFERTRRESMGIKNHPLLENIIQVPDGLDKGIFKCRVIYDREIVRLEFESQNIRAVKTLKLVVSNTISYRYKYADRAELNKLFEQRNSCDDILIVKDGNITDSYYANVALWDGFDWYTPDSPLLPGTMRASLLSDGSLLEKRVRVEEINKYEKIRLINAMNSLHESKDIPVVNIAL